MLDRVIILDTETTGDSPTDQIVELATVEIPGWLWHTTLVKPTVPIDVRARAVHHIQDSELDGAPAVASLMPWGENCVYAAHNMAFDARLLLQSGVPIPERRICTWRCSLHLWPDAPSHKNQVLRYYLDIRLPIGLNGIDISHLHPHRALYDAAVTAGILERMLLEKTVDELIALTTTPVLLKDIKFGTHKGKPWSEVPEGYLRWILRQGLKTTEKDDGGFDIDVIHTARHHLGLL